MNEKIEVKLRLYAISRQARIVEKVLRQYELFDPKKPNASIHMVRAMIDYARNPNREASCKIDLGYNNVRVYFELKMQDVTTDGISIQMAPGISHIEIVDYPEPFRSVPYLKITEDVQRALGLRLWSHANAPIEDDEEL